MSKPRALVIGISGGSCSGKTTLARLLRDIFPASFILHEDDFAKPEDQLPTKLGLLDWDSPDSMRIPDLEKALLYIHSTGTLPPELNSREDQNSVGKSPVSDNEIVAQKVRVQRWLQQGSPGHALLESDMKFCFVDGFLLYCTQMKEVMKALDLKLFLLVNRAKVVERRAARDGYVTLEGFWKDPPEYVEKIVWPNYANAHRWLFEDGNVEGMVSVKVLAEENIEVQTNQALDVPMDTTLEWAVGTIMRNLEVFLQKP